MSHSLMLDARRSLQLPLMREVSHLQKIRTFQDQATSSSTPSPSASSYGGKAKSLLGDPHADAEALALQLSAKLATTAKVVTRDDGGFRVEILQQKVEEKEMTADAAAHRGGSNGDLKKTIDAIVRKLDDPQEGRRPQTGLTYGDVRDRIRRLESVFEGLPQRGVTVTKPKTPERDAPSSEVNSTDRIFSDLQERRRKDSQNGGGIQGWQGELNGREETVDRVMMERNGTPSPLSRLLSNQSALSLLGMEEGHESEIVENFSQAGKGEVSPVQREMKHQQQTNPKTPLMIPRDSLHLREIKTSSSRKKTEGINLRRSRNRKSSSSAARSVNLREPPLGVIDDELDVSELPRNAACGMPWDWSREQKYKGKGFVEVQRNNNGGLRNPSVGGSFSASWREAEMAEEGLHLQSSMDSDATSLHLIVGQNMHDSDLARFHMESDATVPAREIPQQFGGCPDEPLQQPSVAGSRHPSSHARSPLEMFDGHRNLSQKYRPKTFNDLVGQHLVVKALTTAIFKAKVAPVYLFMGPRGTGKTSAARIFASGLNCLSSDAKIRPCGICPECGTMSLNRSLDVKEIDAASKLELVSMRAGMGSLVPQARYKVIIVEACDMLSTEIWNAFLKVLEEPPRNVVFILITTDAERIPLTAISRCQRFLFYKLKEEEIVGRLRGIAAREDLEVEDGALSIIAAGADGSLRDAEMTLDQLILLDNNITLALVQELVGQFPDGKVMDLLDSALSADTVSTVRTMREILSSGVESMSLLSQLGALITDILVGSCDVHRDTRKGFFSRGLPAREEQRRLRHALKVLSEAEKQLRTSDTRPTWLTAALLQFAPDHSFLPSPAAQSPLGPESLDPRGGTMDPCTPRGFTPGGPLVMREQIQTEHFAEPALGRNLRTLSDNKRVAIPDVRNRGEESPVEDGFADTERKLEEAWTEEPQLNQAHEDDEHVREEDEEEEQAQKPLGFEDFEILTEQASSELWKRVVQELTSNFLKRLLQTQGRLVIAAVASDGSSAIVEVEFQSARYRQKAERSWRSISNAFQAVLRTPVETRISLPEDHCEDTLLTELAREMADETQAPQAMDLEKEKERLEEEAHAAAYLREMRGAPMHSKRRRSRSSSQKHRQIAEAASSEAPDRELLPGSEMGSFSRPAPRRRRRRSARRPLLEGESSRSESSWTRSGSLGDISMDSALLPDTGVPVKSRKNSLDRMETVKEDGKSTRNKNFTDESQGIEHKNLSSEPRQKDPHESILCWKKHYSPLFGTTWRMAMVKGRRRAQGQAMFLKLVPCAKTNSPATLNVTTLNHAPLSPILENDSTTA